MEWALLTPILLLVIGAVIQFALVMNARHVALAAAQTAAREARTQPRGAAWQGPASQKVDDVIHAIGSHVFQSKPTVQFPGSDADNRYVEVQAQAVAILPGLNFTVVQRAGGPIECFRPDQGQGTNCQ